MIRTTGFKRAFLIPSRNRGVFSSRSFGDSSFDGWGANIIPSRDYINSVIFDRRVTFRRASGISRNPSPSTFHRLFLLPWKNK